MSPALRVPLIKRREWLLVLVTTAAAAWLATGGWRPSAARPTVPPYPDYPRVNSAVCYEVDPHWPQRPADVTWGPVTGVSVDDSDQVWLCSSGRPPVQVYNRQGRFLHGWGGRFLDHPHQLRIDADGFVWVVDGGLHVVRKFSPAGELLVTLGTPGVAGNDESHFNTPTDVAITPAGHVFVTDGYRNSRVVHFAPDNAYVKSWGQLGSKSGQLSLPHSIVVGPAGRLYVAERANGRVQIFDQQGQFVDQWLSLVVPWGLSATREGKIWVCGSSPTAWRDGDIALGTPPRDQLLIQFNPKGRALRQWYVEKANDGEQRPGLLNWVHCIAEDSHGALYCGDCRNNRIQKYCRTASP